MENLIGGPEVPQPMVSEAIKLLDTIVDILFVSKGDIKEYLQDFLDKYLEKVELFMKINPCMSEFFQTEHRQVKETLQKLKDN